MTNRDTADDEFDDTQMTDQDIMIHEILGTPLGAYAASTLNDDEVLRHLILEGYKMAKLLGDNPEN